jgi:hypothetical protein
MVAIGCGDATPEAESPSVVRAPDSAVVDSDSTGTAPALSAPPTEIAAACLRGEPAEGTRWSLDGVTSELLQFSGIESLVSRDSARLAARISAATDALPSDTLVADFRGLPVAVRAAWRIVPADGDTAIVALVARRVPIESAPLEELFAIVAAPGQRQGVRDPLIVSWVVRDVGREEELVARELVGAFRVGDALALVLAHDATSGPRAEMLVRRDGRWHTEWTGPLHSCGADAQAR